MRIYNEELSRREVALLAHWERERRVFVTIGAIRKIVGAAPAVHVATALVRKGVLQRLKRGLYLVRPIRSLLKPTAPSSAMALGVLLHSEPYYLGGLWALSFHRLSDQQYVSILDAFVAKQHKARNLPGARITFRVLAKKLFVYGIERTRIEGVDVAVSDLERTLVDALEYPRRFGGLATAIELVSGALPRVDTRKLVDYALRGARTRTRQRLGVLLERKGISVKLLGKLNASVRTRSSLSMVPGPRLGTFNRQWHVVENDQ